MPPEASIADDLRAALAADELDISQELETALEPETPPEADAEAEPELAADAETPDKAPAVDPAAERARPGPAGAPEHWSAEDKRFFAGLADDAARARVLDWRKSIERGAQDRFDQAAEARREIAEIDRMLQPIAPQLQAAGLTRLDTVRQLLATEQRLRSDPLGGLEQLVTLYARQAAGSGQAQEMIRRLSHALKVDPGASPEGQADGQDPTARRLAALEAEIARERDQRASAERQHHDQVVKRAETRITEFAVAKDEAGQPAHPHFEAVRPLMSALMQAASAAGEPLDLQEAYARAVWARPDLRDGLIKAHAAADAKLAATRDQAALAKARAAATPRTASAPVTEPVRQQSIRDDLRQALDEQNTAARGRI